MTSFQKFPPKSLFRLLEMSNIPRTPPHDKRSNMSAEQDDQDIELIEHQQFNRGAGLQTYESNVPLNIDQEERMGRQLFSTVMVLSVINRGITLT